MALCHQVGRELKQQAEIRDALAAADAYEVDEHARVRVTLVSGLDAWVSVAA